MGQLRTVPISQIRENTVALRSVSRESEDYIGLVESMRNKGFMGAITVRPQKDSETGEEYFELVDGLHRFNAAKDAGLEEINVDVVSLDEDQVLEAQIMTNIHKVETKPAEYSKQLRRILTRNPLMTESELATKLGKSPQWIQQRLNLNKIDNEKITGLIDEGKITLSNAYALAKLPPEEMDDWVDRAMTESPDEFVPKVNDRVKEIREANRKGKDAGEQEFQPVAHLQKLRDIKSELEENEIGPELIKRNNVSTPQEAFTLALKWVLHLDPDSVEEQKQKDEERKKQREEAKRQREAAKQEKEAEKKRKEAEEAAQAAEEAKSALGE